MLSATQKRPIGLTMEEFAARSDALALRVGARVTSSVIMLACVVVILIGAQSLLGTMDQMDRDIKVLNEQLAIANAGVGVLNEIMESLPKTDRHMQAVVTSVRDTSTEVKTSATNITAMAAATETMSSDVEAITGSTTSMRESLHESATTTGDIATTIDDLNTKMGPLVSTKHRMTVGMQQMRAGLDKMNASLAYTIRIMNHITAPTAGGDMTIRAELPKSALPSIPGLRAEVAPVRVFERNVWPIYTGP